MTGCGLDEALAAIGGKWKSALLWALRDTPLHFGELRRRIEGISEKVLTEQLRQLEGDGLVTRCECMHGRVRRVAYTLTAKGAELNHAVHALAEWGRMHAPAMSPERPICTEMARNEGVPAAMQTAQAKRLQFP